MKQYENATKGPWKWNGQGAIWATTGGPSVMICRFHTTDDEPAVIQTGHNRHGRTLEEATANAELLQDAPLILAQRDSLVEAIDDFLSLKDEEARMQKKYPCGVCNAEDAWRDFGRHEDEVRENLKSVLASVREASDE